MITVMLVDDHELIRIALAKILGERDDIAVVAEAGDGEEALARARETRPEVVIVDVDMPGMGGVEATRRLSALPHKPRVIAISVHDQLPYPQQMLEAGAMGYLPKGGGADEIVAAVRSVARGEPYVAPAIAGKLVMANLHRTAVSPLAALSPREQQIMQMLVQGLGPQAIGETLNISAKTVCTHRYRIYEKLGVDSDVALTHLAYRFGLIKTASAGEPTH